MPEDVIIAAINGAKERDFDTSADALKALKDKGASSAVIKAMLVPAATAAAAPAEDAYAVNDVYVMVDGKAEQLTYIGAEIRSATRGLGFGGAGIYAVLKGPAAERTIGAEPVFIAAIPKNAQPSSYFTLALFAVRPNNDRECMVANVGMGSVRVAIPRERNIAITATKASDQSKAGKDSIIYEIRPAKPLVGGQYALVRDLAASGMGQMSGSYYDFGVK